MLTYKDTITMELKSYTTFQNAAEELEGTDIYRYKTERVQGVPLNDIDPNKDHLSFPFIFFKGNYFFIKVIKQELIFLPIIILLITD